jgi:formylglycine-generating enzyme required for sulfatase activity
MSAQTRNLLHCPRCDSGLAPTDLKCAICGYTDIENVDFLDISDQDEYKSRLEFQRVAWSDFDKALREQLGKFGEGWPRLENWIKIWRVLQPKADPVGFDKRAANNRANDIWSEPPPLPPRIDEVVPPKEPDVSPHLEPVRRWVARLAGGEVNVVAWEKFLQSLDDPVDDVFLESFRDAEIERQFAEFETASVDLLGNLKKGARKRVKRFVERLGDGCSLVLLEIPAGEFQMGSDQYPWEQPVHPVSLPGFYLGQYPVTQKQWCTVARLPRVDIDLSDHFFSFIGEDHPVESVSWEEATEFCARLAKETGRQYRLPSEAEWEYACRAGSRAPFAFGESITPVIVNYDGTSPYGAAAAGIFRRETVAVGSLGAANDFGLYDMHGNVCEWCADEWHENYKGAPEDGVVWTSGNGVTHRVIRGGSWANTAEVCRSSDRSRESADLDTKLHYMGFRVASSRLPV